MLLFLYKCPRNLRKSSFIFVYDLREFNKTPYLVPIFCSNNISPTVVVNKEKALSI